MNNPEKIFLGDTNHKYWGIYEAIVRDNLDPDNRGRIRVEHKFFYNNSLSPWAQVAYPYAGLLDIGMIFIPEIGSGVYIQFKNGAPDEPIVTGCWVAKPKGVTELPTECKSNNVTKVIKTKKFLIFIDDSIGKAIIKSTIGKITLDDSNVSERVKIESEKCSIVLCDEPAGAHKIILNGNATTVI